MTRRPLSPRICVAISATKGVFAAFQRVGVTLKEAGRLSNDAQRQGRFRCSVMALEGEVMSSDLGASGVACDVHPARLCRLPVDRGEPLKTLTSFSRRVADDGTGRAGIHNHVSRVRRRHASAASRAAQASHQPGFRIAAAIDRRSPKRNLRKHSHRGARTSCVTVRMTTSYHVTAVTDGERSDDYRERPGG